MKKFLLSSFCFLLFAFNVASAYTSTDVQNATFLADQNIIVKQTAESKYRLDDTITRAEVVGMALKIKSTTLPESYSCKNYFSDVKYDAKNNWVCRAMEIGADGGIISKSNIRGRPSDIVTRAEALAMVVKVSGIELVEPRRITDVSNGQTWEPYDSLKSFGFSPWQADMLDSLTIMGNCHFFGASSCNDGGDAGEVMRNFNPNRSATRAEVFGFTRNIIESTNSGNQKCYAGNAVISGSCVQEKGVGGEVIKYGKIVDTFTYGDSPYHGYECSIQYFSGNIRNSTLLNGIPIYQIIDQIDTVYLGFMEAGGVHIILGNNGFYYLNTFTTIQNCFSLIDVSDFRKPSHLDVLALYYNNITVRGGAYQMRSPAGVSLELFESWYENVTDVTFREDTLKNLGDNTYEFLVDMTENGTKSTYKVKSKVDLENFTIDNISSVKQ